MTITKSVFQDLTAMSGGRILLSGSFRPNGSSGIVAGSVKGGGFTVVRTSAGLYTVTLDENPAVDLESIFVQAHSEAATGHVNAAAKEILMSTSDKAFQIEVYRGEQGAIGTIQLPLAGQEADGTALADFSNGDTEIPGLGAVLAEEHAGIRWNNKTIFNPVALSFVWPQDMDTLVNATFKCAVAKTGATGGDAMSMTVTVWNQPAAALFDADTGYGGATDAVTPADTATTVTYLSKTLALADLPTTLPGSASIHIQPTDGTLGTDDGYLLAAWIEYSRKMELVDLTSDTDNIINFMALLRNKTGMV